MASVLRMNDENANVMLISCDGTTIKAHANLLRQCPYFANALHTNSKNSTDVVIEVPDGVDGDDLKLFLRAEIYNDGDIPEADFPRYSELLGIFGEEGVVGNDASDAEEESESELSFSDDGIIEDVDATTIARPINGAGAAESAKIVVLRDMLENLKSSTIQTFIDRLPKFEPLAKDVVGDLILHDFMRSRDFQHRKAHLDLYKAMNEKKVQIFGDGEMDVKGLLVPKVEYNFAQHVIGRSEDHFPVIGQNGVNLHAMDDQMLKLQRQLRSDVRHHGRAIVCLFGEFFKLGWISYHSVDLAISALLQAGTNDKLEYFCHLLVLVEAEMERQQKKFPDESLGLAKHTVKIRDAFAKAIPNVQQMYKERQALQYRMAAQNFGIEKTGRKEANNGILEQMYWMRANIASLNADQYYEQSGGFAVRGLESAVVQVAYDDLKRQTIVPETSASQAKKSTNNRVIRVPRVEFFKTLKIMHEKKGKDTEPKNDAVPATQPNNNKMSDNKVPSGSERAAKPSHDWPNKKQWTRSNARTEKKKAQNKLKKLENEL